MSQQDTRKKMTDYQSKYFAYELQRSYANDHVGKLAGLLFDAQVDPKPHQIDAALFALQTPFLPGVILADEVGLGKTIEAGIVISQYWAERKRRILIIAPSSIRQQWQQELFDKFLVPSELLDARSKAMLLQAQDTQKAQVLICSYEFVLRHELALSQHWDLIVADEAHRLRNFWQGSKAKMSKAVSQVMKHANKRMLLTATPLQNRLEELYGLVSVFDPSYFHSLEAFRERYIRSRDATGDDDLVDRVATIAKRTLRKDAEHYIKFTKRTPLTLEFTPSREEVRLYDLVNEYLQRNTLYAFAGSQRHLSALIIRKRLGSSTYAVASTLENIADRLAKELADGERRDGRGGLFTDEDLTSDELEEIDSFSDDRLIPDQASLYQRIKAEVDELRGYAAYARSITVNQKAVRLNDALEQGFERLREIGAPEKAVIFTDSTKTQEYIARSLEESGHGEGLVLFNGTNNSPATNQIYQEWLASNQGSEIVTGIPSADKRKSLVDYFRDKGRILIATEAAAEGINLQFCSMLVNYDLPWNPQRVEQRIGRIHRFGQRHNVIVVNFSNKGNLAEERILKLLADKFQLFENVFRASDQVLGKIEDGYDFEKSISNILNTCKTADEIDAAFDELSEKYSEEISDEMSRTKTKIFDNLDPNVQDRLKSYDEQSSAVMNKFERLLIEITKHELAEYADFDANQQGFTLHDAPLPGVPTGPYSFKSEPQPSIHQYRYASPLGEYVVQSAKNHETPAQELVFSIEASQRVGAAVRNLEGKNGELTVSMVTFQMKVNHEDISESYILAGGYTEDGDWIDDEMVADLMELACVELMPAQPIDRARFEDKLGVQKAEYQQEVQTRNTQYFNQQEDLLYRNMKDRRAEHDAEVREYRRKQEEARKAARNAEDPMEQLRFKKEASRWDRKVDDAEDAYRAQRRKFREETEEALDLIAQALAGTQVTEHLFSIRWRVVA